MARDQAFIVPVCLDATPGAGTDVPESFHRVHWTRLLAGETPPEFVAGIKRLLSPDSPTTVRLLAGVASGASPFPATNGQSTPLRRALPPAVAVLVLVALAYLLINKPWSSKPATPPAPSNATSSPGAPPATSTPPPLHSIAVLPFVDMSEKHDQEYFGDGMAEELIDRLAQLSELRVISRTSAFQFKGKSEDVRAIGAKLAVANILEGSVRRSGDRLRVAVQLVNASDGSHRWSQSYDRNSNDVFKVQDEIANDVVQTLKIKLAGTFVPDAALTENIAAHNLLLEGRFYEDRWGPGDSERAISYYKQALKEDPGYALAWAELSWAEMWSWQVWNTPGFYERATHAALRAIELRPDLAQGHATRGWCESLLGFDWAVADMEFSKALAIDPQNMRALYGKGRLARVLGRTDEALRYYRAALERDPINAFVIQGLSETLTVLGRGPEAVDSARKALNASPSITWGHWYLGYALLWNGELEAALREMRLESTKSASLSGVALVEQARRDPRAADAALRDLLAIDDLPKPYFVAAVYAARGDSKTAIAWLERARMARNGFFGEVTTDPAFNAIRSDSAFVAYLRRMKLPGVM